MKLERNTQMLKHKFTLALNQRIAEETLAKVCALACASLVANADDSQVRDMRFLNFVDKDGASHDGVSALSLIVMRGKSGELKKFRDAARGAKLLVAEVSREAISKHPELGIDVAGIPSEQEVLAVAVFGEITEINKTTGKMSLWRQ
jgi:hypothetical protein